MRTRNMDILGSHGNMQGRRAVLEIVEAGLQAGIYAATIARTIERSGQPLEPPCALFSTGELLVTVGHGRWHLGRAKDQPRRPGRHPGPGAQLTPPRPSPIRRASGSLDTIRALITL